MKLFKVASDFSDLLCGSNFLLAIDGDKILLFLSEKKTGALDWFRLKC